MSAVVAGFGVGGGSLSEINRSSVALEYMSHSLNSLKGGYVGDNIGDDNRGY